MINGSHDLLSLIVTKYVNVKLCSARHEPIMQAHDMNKTTCKLFVIPPVFFRALQFTLIIIRRLPG